MHCVKESVRSPGTGVTDSCESPHGCWGLNPSPLEEQPVLLTAGPSLQHRNVWKLMCSWSQEAELTFVVADISCFEANNTSWAEGFSPPTHTHPKSHHEGWQWHERGPAKNTQLWAGWSQCQIKWQGEDLGDGSSGRGTCWASLVLWAHVKVERERLMPGSRPLASASALPSTSAHAHTPTVCSFKICKSILFFKKPTTEQTF